MMDHHCIWTNNCLGYNTLKPFLLFNFYVCVLCVFGVSTTVVLISDYIDDGKTTLIPKLIQGIIEFRPWGEHALAQVCFVVVCYGSASFFAFSSTMVYTVATNVRNNESMVDQIKLLN